MILLLKKKTKKIVVSDNIGLSFNDFEDIMDKKNTKKITDNIDKKKTEKIREEIKINSKVEKNFLKS